MPDVVHLAPVVEGHGETNAVPSLLYRVAAIVAPTTGLVVHPPIRVSRDKLIKAGEIERAVMLAAVRVVGRGGVLVLIDADDDCPAELGPSLKTRAQSARLDVPVSVVLAKSEFESWFIAGAESLRGKRDLPDDLSAPADPESIRDAKGWLSQEMPQGRVYSATVDQAKLVADLDVGAARISDSFDKFYRETDWLMSLPDPPGSQHP